MLTYSKQTKVHRKDRPLILILMVIIWISGATFFHEPWEPYEPFVVAVVKNMLTTNSWLVPYINQNIPYLEIQPFYFWLYALIIKLGHLTNIVNAIRLINSLLIIVLIGLMGKVGSGLNAFKNGRNVVMILISTVGFINNAYQLSPNLVVLLGFSLYLYALQQSSQRPGLSGWWLGVSLILISLNFTGEFILIALIILFLLPLISKNWQFSGYYISLSLGLMVFILIFGSYAWQLNKVDHSFFIDWEHKYTDIFAFKPFLWWYSLIFYLYTLAWYLVPSFILVGWTVYKRRKQLFNDKILLVCVLLTMSLILCACLSPSQQEAKIFPIILPIVLLASVEIDSVRISIVALMNWFSICIFGVVTLCIGALYFALCFGHPIKLLHLAKFYVPQYQFNFNLWQFLLALTIMVLWLFMITRKQIRGREMISNWASGITCGLVMFVSLCMPWFNSMLSFQDLVKSSEPYLDNKATCIATYETNSIQSAVWYYYANIRLKQTNNPLQTNCKKILLGSEVNQLINYPGWHIIWSSQRPIDTKHYLLLERDD